MTNPHLAMLEKVEDLLRPLSFSIVRDRQDVRGKTAGDRNALVAALNARILEACRTKVTDLLRADKMRASERQDFELYDDRYFSVVANTQASFGYLYITAWFKAHDETPHHPCCSNI